MTFSSPFSCCACDSGHVGLAGAAQAEAREPHVPCPQPGVLSAARTVLSVLGRYLGFTLLALGRVQGPVPQRVRVLPSEALDYTLLFQQ